MPLSARLAAILSPLALLALAPAGAAAQQAAPAERCSGTLCDLYYGGSAPDAAGQKPAPPTPLSVPTGGVLGFFSGPTPAQAPAPGAQPAKPGFVQVQGGGIVGAVNGKPAERCSGTLCDFYYGSSTSSFDDPPAEQPTAVVTDPADAAPADDAPRSRKRRAEVQVPREKPLCVGTAADPWRCYR